MHMRLGIARDWDLFAAHAPVFVLAAWLAWSEAAPKRNGTHLVGLVAGVAFIVVLPWFLLNPGEERSTKRFRDVIADQSPYARAYAHEEMGRYFRNSGMFSEALLEFEACIEISPGNARLYDCLGELQYRLGDKSASLETYLSSESVSTFSGGTRRVRLLASGIPIVRFSPKRHLLLPSARGDMCTHGPASTAVDLPLPSLVLR
jgi:hypothetical protein